MNTIENMPVVDNVDSTTLSAQAMAARPTPYLDELNPAQRKAVETLDGPVLMLSGAGTGKTKALTARIAHLLNTRRAYPSQILAVTFTNKAAREMKARVGKLLGQQVEGMPWLGTFHAICVKLLRRHAELAGLESNFTILDTDDQLRLLKQLVRAANVDEKMFPPRLLAVIIDGWKNRALTPGQVPAAEHAEFRGRGLELYSQYQQRLRELNAVDFGDLLLHMVAIFQQHKEVLERYRNRFAYILVDEYQDTNVAQYLWLRLLAAGRRNICCVGDDDQSIYGWRGAEVGNILRFERDFPGARVIRLEQNYRSTPHILAAASCLISANRSRLGKTLWTEERRGEKVRLVGHNDGDEEARWIGEEIVAMQRGTRGIRPMNLDGIAILVRAAHQMRAFEDRFLTIGLPYRVIGGPRFYERREIRDAVAYFRLVVSPEDDLAFERIMNVPRRGLGESAQKTIQVMARESGICLLEGAIRALDAGLLKGRAATGLRGLVDALGRWRRMAATAVPHDDDAVVLEPDLQAPDSGTGTAPTALAEMILDESGYAAMWRNDNSPDAPGRLENLKELVKSLDDFENLQGFLDHVSLVMDNEAENSEAKVSLMTLHAAKGLEFPAVFLPGWEDGLFPSQRSMDGNGAEGIEEERRLAYVGITRAEEICTVSFAIRRLIHGQFNDAIPSRFIDELPPEHVEVVNSPSHFTGSQAYPASRLEKEAVAANVYNSPGWRRLTARTGNPNPAPKRERVDSKVQPQFGTGDRIFHQKFGYGTVVRVDGAKLEIDFEKAGTKKVVARFVTRPGDIPL